MPTRTSTKKRSPKKKNAKGTPKPPSTALGSKYNIPNEELALEHTISRILLLRFQQDIARLFSTHIHHIALFEIPRLIISALNIAPPGWVALNANSDDVKDFFRGALAMDMRQAGERVATKSVLWSYTAIRHFVSIFHQLSRVVPHTQGASLKAVSHNVPICGYRGLHSHLLVPHHGAMRAHLKTLESLPPPCFSKPPHLGTLSKGFKALERHCLNRQKNTPAGKMPLQWLDWKPKIRDGYERMVETLWEVADELDVRGYGLVLREKLTDKWCCLSCLGTVCEPTVRTDDDHKHVGPSKGKEREWDGRGSGVYGWETAEEEDMWKAKLDFGGLPNDELDSYADEDEAEDAMSIGELMEWRYIKAEREKELGNVAFKSAQYEDAIRRYQAAYQIESEIPHYQLNLAAAHLKLTNWMEAESACTIALGQQKSGKAYWRRAKARKMLGRFDEAEQDLKAILQLQPNNIDAIQELDNLRPPVTPDPDPYYSNSPSSSPHAAFSSPASCSHGHRPHSPQTNLYGTNRLNDKPISWEVHEKDQVKLKIQFLPLTIQIDPYVGRESFSYPTWDRYTVQKV